ncbi:LON peptidase N-terminal domain and RING finger protein 1-like [Petromyzon marinus]|uniref:LON peptidase N-terminal domain and RING finger protein 1-like n=1 Tax=Petromyzon marinus TaxID=7757 RepID=UPI003F708025
MGVGGVTVGWRVVVWWWEEEAGDGEGGERASREGGRVPEGVEPRGGERLYSRPRSAPCRLEPETRRLSLRTWLARKRRLLRRGYRRHESGERGDFEHRGGGEGPDMFPALSSEEGSEPWLPTHTAAAALCALSLPRLGEEVPVADPSATGSGKGMSSVSPGAGSEPATIPQQQQQHAQPAHLHHHHQQHLLHRRQQPHLLQLQQHQQDRLLPNQQQEQQQHQQQRADDDPAGVERAPRDSGSAEEGVGVAAATPKVQSGVRWGPGNPLSCPLCRGMLSEPVSAPCGHAFCRRCLEQEPSGECAACRRPFQLLDVREHRPNIVACKLLLKWFPRESEAARMRHEALELLQERRAMHALAKCQAAMELAPGDSALLCVRARCHAATGHWEAALLDAENVCRLEPTWHQGFLTKGHSQEALGLREDALTAFLHCLALRPNCVDVKACVDKLLAELLSPALQRSPLDFLQRVLGRPPIASGTTTGTTTASTTSSSSSSRELTLGNAAPEKEDGAGCSEEEVGDGRGSLVDEVPLQKRLKRKCSVEEEEEGPEEEDGTGRSLLSLGRPRKLMKRCDSASEWGTWPALSAVAPALIDPTDMECSLCMRLLYEPVTTPCGHSFCLRCLERCLDYNPRCPLCKETLAQYLALQRYSACHLLKELAARYMAEALAERRSAHLDEIAEMSSLTQDVPVFVCTVAFPSLPCPLHVFEPRYRLMVRRCLETGTRRFGMCLGNASGFTEFGCMLGVQSTQLMPDGRSVVYTVGERRFRVVQRSHRDGYNTANIEYLEDVKVEEEEAYTELQALHEEVYVQAAAWFGSLRSRLRSQVLLHFGTLPAKEADLQASVDGPAWCWWLLAVLPLDGQAQLKVLAMTSLHDRLRALSRVLAYVSGRSR